MAKTVTFKVNGLQELGQTFAEIQNDFGEKDAKKILQTATLKAMKTDVLPTAEVLVPVNTGLLQSNLVATAKKPTNKDKKSVYVNPTDVVIGLVQTRAIPKKLKKTIKQLYGGLSKTEYGKKRKQFLEEKGHLFDARAIANEFGTANMVGKPFLRPALESKKDTVLTTLGTEFNKALSKYEDKKGTK